METNCLICDSVSGKKRISPGPKIFSGKFWGIEHVYPTLVRGWLVLVLKRHVESLDSLTDEEWKEWQALTKKCCKILKDILKCEKEYVMIICEKPGFEHIHTHIIPISSALPDELRGTKIFSLLDDESKLSKKSITDNCELLIPLFNSTN